MTEYNFPIDEDELNFTAFVYAVRKLIVYDGNEDPMAQGGIDKIPTSEEEFKKNWWFKNPITREVVERDIELPDWDMVEIEYEYQKDVVKQDYINGNQISQRMNEYPPWEEQLDRIYHDGIDVWKADIKAIKDKYPKLDTNLDWDAKPPNTSE